MIKILFVCLGNICRSPMAEAVMRHRVKENQLEDRIFIDSCGTAGYHIGDSPHKGTQTVLDAQNISTEGIYSRKIKKADLDDFDYIVGMDDSNITDIQVLGNNEKIYKITDFILNSKYKHVPDPYYEGNFDLTYEIISLGCDGLLKHIARELKLNKHFL